jgi:hypothetical protein
LKNSLSIYFFVGVEGLKAGMLEGYKAGMLGSEN